MPEVRNFLTLSTGHVPREVAEALDSNFPDTWPVCGGPFNTFGWFMYAHDEDCEGTIPPELMRVFEYALSVNCNYVLFDCDADVLPALPSWDW